MLASLHLTSHRLSHGHLASLRFAWLLDFSQCLPLLTVLLLAFRASFPLSSLTHFLTLPTLTSLHLTSAGLSYLRLVSLRFRWRCFTQPVVGAAQQSGPILANFWNSALARVLRELASRVRACDTTAGHRGCAAERSHFGEFLEQCCRASPAQIRIASSSLRCGSRP